MDLNREPWVFTYEAGGSRASVLVHEGRRVAFPHPRWDTGESLGDELDHAVRAEAEEDLRRAHTIKSIRFLEADYDQGRAALFYEVGGRKVSVLVPEGRKAIFPHSTSSMGKSLGAGERFDQMLRDLATARLVWATAMTDMQEGKGGYG